jgi:hypothetical protein
MEQNVNMFKILFEPQQGEHQSQSLDPHWLKESRSKLDKIKKHLPVIG